MNLNIPLCVSLVAVLLFGVWCDDAPNINEDTTPWLKRSRAERSKRIKRAPAPTINFGFRFGSPKKSVDSFGESFSDSVMSPNWNPTPLPVIHEPMYRPLSNIGIQWPRIETRNSAKIWVWRQMGWNRPQTKPTLPYPSIEPSTKRPFESTTENPAGGCVLPKQPNAGSYKIAGCVGQCDVIPGARVPVGSMLSYSCRENYVLKESNFSFCTPDKTWYTLPTCIRTCRALESDSVDIVCRYQGKIVPCQSKIIPGTSATLECKSFHNIPLGYDPVYRKINCLETGNWDRRLFKCIPECGIGIPQGTALIVNGFRAKYDSFPWHVAIYENYTTGSYQQTCGGSLVSPNLIVSAAHCFVDETKRPPKTRHVDNFAVAAGKFYRSYDRRNEFIQYNLVENINNHNRYRGYPGNYAADIALVRVKTPFSLSTLVKPICLDWEDTYERQHLQAGSIGKVVGWGKTAQGDFSEELQEINLPFIPYLQCISAVPEYFTGFITPDKFCAGYLNGSSLCNGDSGGGLSFQTGGRWYLRGIVSLSPRNGDMCDNHFYSAFTNVGEFRDWIRDIFTSSG